MTNPLPPQRIEIPDAVLEQQAGGIVLAAVREAGLDPVKAARNAMMRQMVGTWGRGEWTRSDFVRACRNLAILNPSLKA